ncbi:unnamed protein product [Pylaiella littoralis]
MGVGGCLVHMRTPLLDRTLWHGACFGLWSPSLTHGRGVMALPATSISRALRNEIHCRLPRWTRGQVTVATCNVDRRNDTLQETSISCKGPKIRNGE